MNDGTTPYKAVNSNKSLLRQQAWLDHESVQNGPRKCPVTHKYPIPEETQVICWLSWPESWLMHLFPHEGSGPSSFLGPPSVPLVEPWNSCPKGMMKINRKSSRENCLSPSIKQVLPPALASQSLDGEFYPFPCTWKHTARSCFESPLPHSPFERLFTASF